MVDVKKVIRMPVYPGYTLEAKLERIEHLFKELNFLTEEWIEVRAKVPAILKAGKALAAQMKRDYAEKRAIRELEEKGLPVERTKELMDIQNFKPKTKSP